MKLKVVYALFITLIIGLQPVSAYALNVQFLSTNNTRVNFSQYEGKILLVDTFAKWCEPCKTEIPRLYDLKNAVPDNVVILSLDVSPSTDSISDVRAFKTTLETDNNQKYTWMFGLDDKEEFINKFPISNIPTLFLFDQNGNLNSTWEGITNPEPILLSINASLANLKNTYNPLRQLLNNFAFQITLVILVLATTYFYVIPKKYVK